MLTVDCMDWGWSICCKCLGVVFFFCAGWGLKVLHKMHRNHQRNKCGQAWCDCFIDAFQVCTLFFFFTLFCFTVLHWLCHTSTWIRHGCTWVPNPELPSHLPLYTIPLGHPSAPAPSILYPASNLDWRFISYMILYMFQCHSPKSSHPLPLPQSPKDCSIHLCLFCCLAYRVIITIFLNSIYMCEYTVLVFFFLAYFTPYNRLQFHPPH